MRLLRYFRKKYKIEKQFRGYWVFKREKLVKKFDSWAPFDTALGFAEYDRELTGIEVEEIYAHSFRNRLIKKRFIL